MSQIQTAFIEKSRVPDRAKLEEAIRTLGFDLTLPESYRPFGPSCFLPCVLNGKKSGFEILFESPDYTLEHAPRLKDVIGRRNCAISFRWNGDTAEDACVLIVSAALAKSFDAVIYYEDGNLLYSVEELLDEVKAIMPAEKPWWKLW